MFGLSGIEGVFAITLALMPYVIGTGALWIAWRFVRTREHQANDLHSTRQLEQRVQFLEETLGRMSTQLEQITQSQEFTAELLEARSKDPRRTT